MEESAEEAFRREETLRLFNSTKEALRIIADVARDTISEAIPPPIKGGYESTMSMNTLTISSHSARPASPKPARHAPTAPSTRPAPAAPPIQQMQQQQYQPAQQTPPPVQQQQQQAQQPQQQSQNSFSFSVNPSQLANAFNNATSFFGNVNSIKSKLDGQPPARPAPVPNSNSSLPNPLVPS